MMELIVRVVAKYYRLQYKDVFMDTRVARIVRARQMAMYLCREKEYLTYQEIADFFNKNHVTAIHAYKVVTNEISVSKSKNNEYTQINLMLFEEKVKTNYTRSLTPANCIPMRYGFAS